MVKGRSLLVPLGVPAALALLLAGCLSSLDGLSAGEGGGSATGTGASTAATGNGTGTGTGGSATTTTTSSGGGAGNGGAGGSPACDPDALSDDPLHCGACGHSCLGGSCADGRCAPVVLAEGEQGPDAVAVDATAAFWATREVNAIRRAPLSIGATSLVLASDANYTFNPNAIALSSTSVVLTNENAFNGGAKALGLVDKRGGAGAGFAGSIADGPSGLAVFEGHYYFAMSRFLQDVQPWGIFRATLGAPDFEVVYQNDQEEAHPRVVAVAAGIICWVGSDGEHRLGCLTAEGPLPYTEFRSTQDVAEGAGVAVDAAGVYVSGDGIIRRFSHDLLTSTLLTADTPNPGALALDATHLYWVAEGAGGETGQLARIPLAGGEVEVLATGLRRPQGLALDDVSVVFTERGLDGRDGTGLVKRLAK